MLVTEYRERGFITLPQVLDAALVARLVAETERLYEAGRALTQKTRHYDLEPGHVDSRHRNKMVRGEPARHARVEAGVIELPPDFSAGYSGIYALQESRS